MKRTSLFYYKVDDVNNSSYIVIDFCDILDGFTSLELQKTY